jgi:hypothetical protein
MHTRMDAAVAVDAQNAPTATWNTAQTAVSHSAHTHHRFAERKTEEASAPHTENLTLPRKQKGSVLIGPRRKIFWRVNASEPQSGGEQGLPG